MLFLQPPEIRETRVHTRMPERFRRTGVRSDWADANRGGQPTDSFLEGPVFDDHGGADRKTLYCTESASGSVLCATLEAPGLALHHGPLTRVR